VPSRSGRNSFVSGHARINWTSRRFTIHIDGVVPSLTPVCAGDFIANPAGAEEIRRRQSAPTDKGESAVVGARVTKLAGSDGATRAQLEVGQMRAAARVLFHVKSSTRTVVGGHYVDSGLQWKYLTASPDEMDAGRHSVRETTINAAGKAGA
ncbi:MAG TPA: hypothetical protein VGS41_17455, partial [Chthonomonadales bacterium]|nr:hypothetical protein [Chthonomonadales bacterium]